MREPNAVMIPLEEALDRLDEVVSVFRLETETLPVRASLGRVLRVPAYAKLALPPFDKSAVDGYALPADNTPAGDERALPAGGSGGGEYRLLETVHAGETGSRPLLPGTTVKVMTGAPVPAGTERVVMVEHAGKPTAA